eukprot:2069999-Rhodomonas_salina.1
MPDARCPSSRVRSSRSEPRCQPRCQTRCQPRCQPRCQTDDRTEHPLAQREMRLDDTAMQKWSALQRSRRGWSFAPPLFSLSSAVGALH